MMSYLAISIILASLIANPITENQPDTESLYGPIQPTVTPDPDTEYLVVHTPSYSTTIQPLVTYRSNEFEVAVEELPSGSSFNTVNNLIRQYNNACPDLEYLLLVGGHDQLCGVYEQTPWPPSGGYLSDGFWAHGIAGSSYPIDGLGLYVGRLPGTVAEVATQVGKILDYETAFSSTLDFRQNGQFVNNVIGCAHEEEYPHRYAGHTRYLAHMLYTYTDLTWREIYPPEGQDPSYLLKYFIDPSNEGAGVVTYHGHGASDGESWTWHSDWDEDDIEDLTNSEFYPVVIDMSCWSGRIQNSGHCVAESWLAAQNKGASAVFANAHAMMHEQGNGIMSNLVLNLFSYGRYRLGKALYYAEAPYWGMGEIYRECISEFHLYGDPAMKIWTQENASSHFTSPIQPLACDENGSVEAALVAATENGIGSDGHIQIRIAMPERTDVRVSVFDMSGRCIETLHNGEMPSGVSMVYWDASMECNGVYFATAEYNGTYESCKLVLAR